MAGEKQSRTEKPTSRKLQKAREKGQIARSKEVSAAFVLLGGVLFLYYGGHGFLVALQLRMRSVLDLSVPAEMTLPYVAEILRETAVALALVVGPFMLTMLLLAITANVSQGGIAVSSDALSFKFEKLNPKQGVSKIFSKNGLAELVKGVLLLSVVAYLSYQVIGEHFTTYPRLVLMDTRQLLHWVTTIGFQVLIRVAIFFVLVAIADYAFQRYRFLEQLKMTKQDVKDELKDAEGDPRTRSRIRRIQVEMSRKRMMAEVPNADVIVTNPTHYAVALSYKLESMEAPKVVAKGVGFLAIKIKELAQEHRVPRVENKVLAQTLYKSVEVGQIIPSHLYQAVAEILAYIYKARENFRG